MDLLNPAGRENELFGIALERKALGDFLACVTIERERFEKELRRLRCYQYASVVIETDLGTILRGGYRSEVRPASVVASLTAWETRLGVHFHQEMLRLSRMFRNPLDTPFGDEVISI